MKLFNNADHPRNPVGDGTFDFKRQTKPELNLGDGTRNKDSSRDYAGEMRDPRTARLAAAKFLAETTYHVEYNGRRAGLEPEQIADAVGDAIVDLTHNYLNAGKPIGLGLIKTRAITVAAMHKAGPIRHETDKGIRELESRIAEDESILGRPVTDEEIAFLAKDIRRDWPDPRHRPQEGFHTLRARLPVSMDPEELIDAADANWELNEHAQRSTHEAEIDDLIEHEAKAIRKQNAYTVYAKHSGLPPVQPDAMTKHEAADVRAHVVGQVTELAQAFLDGYRSHDQEGLFAPFATSESEKKVLAAAFVDNAEFAERLWSAAADGSTRRKLTRDERLHEKEVREFKQWRAFEAQRTTDEAAEFDRKSRAA